MDSTVAGSPFGQVPIEITISVGRARPLIRDLVKLTQDSILPLDRRIDDPVELFVGDKMIARGVLKELEGDNSGQLAVCLTEVSDFGKGL
ncbi:MAG: FliM/FliN family flagellar motor switch protein [Alphaproteobacteria bacterium]|nr:FliM/FliN family flagellar motor switch protein [Alphaproteobacteria bacterium]